MIIEKIKSILLESLNKKSFSPLFWAIRLFFYNLFKLKSLESAVQEQKLSYLIPQLQEISPNYLDHYNHVKIEGEYLDFSLETDFQTTKINEIHGSC